MNELWVTEEADAEVARNTSKVRAKPSRFAFECSGLLLRGERALHSWLGGVCAMASLFGELDIGESFLGLGLRGDSSGVCWEETIEDWFVSVSVSICQQGQTWVPKSSSTTQKSYNLGFHPDWEKKLMTIILGKFTLWEFEQSTVPWIRYVSNLRQGLLSDLSTNLSFLAVILSCQLLV